MPTDKVRTTLAQFRDWVTAVLDNPDNVATEMRTFLAQYADRAQQQARKTAAAVQEGATVGWWVTFGVLLLTLVVPILETMAGSPSLHTWRLRRARVEVEQKCRAWWPPCSSPAC